MNTIRTLALAAVTAGTAAFNVDSVLGALVGDGVHAAPLAIREDTCAELPRLCTGQVLMAGVATTLTYFCPEPTQLEAPSTVHITVTKTTTVTPPDVESTQGPVLTPSVAAPAPVEPDTTTTIHSTFTTYKIITVIENTPTPSPPAVSITGYVSATIPSELQSVVTPRPTETVEPVLTIQTSTPAVTSGLVFPTMSPPVEPVITNQTSTPAVTSSFVFPTLSPPVTNGTTTGIFYSEPVANSSVIRPTGLYPNTTSAHSHYAAPTVNLPNRAAEEHEGAKGAAGKTGACVLTLITGMMVAALVV